MKTIRMGPAWGNLAALALVLCAGILLSGCNKAKTEKPSSPPKSTTNTTVKASDRPVMSEDEAAMLAPFTQPGNLSEADKAWNDLLKTLNSITVPPRWQTNEPTREEIALFEKESARLMGEAADKAKNFYTRFPQDEKAAAARKQEFALLNAAAQSGDTNRLAQLQALEEAQLKDPKVSEEQRLEVRMAQLQRQISKRQEESPAAALAELDKGVRALKKEFPNRPEITELQFTAAQAWLHQGQVDKSRSLAKEIVDGDADEEVKTQARELLKKADRVGQPLQIKFTAVDGRQVDLQQMKGKVVLVDFWATWCRPCLAELPKLKAVYEKFHTQGFEIVGLSFDDDKEALDKLLANEKMTWPQYFNAEDAGKKWGDEFGVTGIPAMWLVDKKGVLRDLNGREDLAGKVEKLLAEK